MKEIKDLGVNQDSRFSGNSTNTKELYIVVTDEPSFVTSKTGKFAATNNQTVYLGMRADETGATVKMSGYNVTHNANIIAQVKDAKTYNEALDLAKNENLEFQVLTFPWQRIIRIQQLKFTIAK